MSTIDAVYRHGVFEPLGPVSLQEDQRVRLTVDTTTAVSPDQWLNEMRVMQTAIIERSGNLPDSAPEIAADRLR